MNQLEQTGQNFPAKRYRLFIIAGGAFIAAWAIHQMMSLALLSVALFAGAQVIYLAWFRLSAKTRETEELSRMHFATAEALATAIDAKDQTTHCHVRRVQVYAAELGEVLGLGVAEISALKAGALLHDVGKLAVPAHIINKPGRLTPAEFEKMKIHTTVGAQILSRIDFPYPVTPIVRHHHERWDGQGYPDGLAGAQIPITARIISVVDCFDSVREDRPYRRGMTREEAKALLLRGAGMHFDPKIVQLFLKNLPRFEDEILALGLGHEEIAEGERLPITLADASVRRASTPALAYDQIKNAN